MAVFRHGKDVGVMLGRWNLSPYLTEALAARTVDTAETTTMGAQDKTFIVGEMDGKVTLKGLYSYDAGSFLDAETVMDTLVGSARTVKDAVTNTDTSLVSATANFTQDDVGASVTGTNIFVPTTIASVTNGTTVVLSHVTTGTGSALTVTVATHPVALAPFAVCADAGFAFGRPAQVGIAFQADLETASVVTGVGTVNGGFQASGGIRNARILSAGLESVAATANGTGYLDPPNVSTTSPFPIGLYLFVPVNTRNGTIAVKVQHSADNSAWADLGSAFTTVAAATTTSQQIVVAAGTLVNKYLRVVYTVAGSTGAASILVAASRH